MTSPAQASRDYYRVAEGFLTCLEQINNAVLKVTKSPPKSETERGRNVAALYSHIYLFLGRFMDFYLGRTVCRLLYSHNENFYQNFRITAQTIADAADGISKGQSPDFVYRNTILKRVRCRELPRLTGLEGSLRDATSQTVHVQQLIWDIQMSKEATQQLAASGTDRLYGLARTFTDLEESDSSDQMDNGDSPKESSVSLLSDHRSPPPTPSTSRRCLTRLSLLNASRDLQSFVDKDDQIEPVDLDTPPQIPPAISRALYEWTRDPQSGQLTVTVDESEFPECSRASIAAYYVWKARQEGIPVISHFCSPARHPKKIPGLIALVYSLIRQLLELAPPKLNFDGAWDLSGDRFQQLDGKIDTWNEALKILDMMMYFRPPLLLCVLDGLEVLESENTAQYIKPLILLLCGRHSPHQSMAKIHGVTKVLFTNSRHSQILQEALEEASTVVDAPLVDPDPPLYIETGKDGDVIMVDS